MPDLWAGIMSVSYGMNCERCGQPYVVEEFDDSFAFLVGGKPVEVCPFCGEDLQTARPLEKTEPLSDLLKRTDDGGS